VRKPRVFSDSKQIYKVDLVLPNKIGRWFSFLIEDYSQKQLVTRVVVPKRRVMDILVKENKNVSNDELSTNGLFNISKYLLLHHILLYLIDFSILSCYYYMSLVCHLLNLL
jgi:hypothetical protein